MSMEWWDWIGIAGLVVGVVAVLMAVQPFIQMWKGRPKVTCTFGEHTEGGKRLIGMLHNHPVGKKMALLGFSRNSVDITVRCTIMDSTTRQEISSTIALLRSPEDMQVSERRAYRLPLPASTMGTLFGVLAWVPEFGRAFVDSQVGQRATHLPTGEYMVHIDLDTGSTVRRLSRLAIVGDTQESTKWGGNGHDIFHI